MKRNTIFLDSYGMLRIGWMLGLVVVGACLLIVLIIVAVAKPISEANCNSKVERLGSPLVVDGDFDFWANECYVTLSDGRVIPMSQHRTIEPEEVIR